MDFACRVYTAYIIIIIICIWKCGAPQQRTHTRTNITLYTRPRYTHTLIYTFIRIFYYTRYARTQTRGGGGVGCRISKNNNIYFFSFPARARARDPIRHPRRAVLIAFCRSLSDKTPCFTHARTHMIYTCVVHIIHGRVQCVGPMFIPTETSCPQAAARCDDQVVVVVVAYTRPAGRTQPILPSVSSETPSSVRRPTPSLAVVIFFF